LRLRQHIGGWCLKPALVLGPAARLGDLQKPGTIETAPPAREIGSRPDIAGPTTLRPADQRIKALVEGFDESLERHTASLLESAAHPHLIRMHEIKSSANIIRVTADDKIYKERERLIHTLTLSRKRVRATRGEE
jgi:hypothetical protein